MFAKRVSDGSFLHGEELTLIDLYIHSFLVTFFLFGLEVETFGDGLTKYL